MINQKSRALPDLLKIIYDQSYNVFWPHEE